MHAEIRSLLLFFLFATTTRAQQPIAEWRLDEPAWSGVPKEVKDATNGGFDGTTVNGPITSSSSFPALTKTTTTEGTCGYGNFNGIDQYIHVPYQAALNPEDFTVALWARVEGNAGTYRSPITSRWEDANGNQQGYIIYAGLDDRWQFWTGMGVYWDILESTGAVVRMGAWTHLAISFQTSSVNSVVRTGTKTLYVNGVVVAQRTGTYRPNRIGDVTIGAGGGSGNQFHFKGAVDEVSIFNSTLSDADVWKLSQKVHLCEVINRTLPVPTAEWLMDEATWRGETNEVPYQISVEMVSMGRR